MLSIFSPRMLSLHRSSFPGIAALWSVLLFSFLAGIRSEAHDPGLSSANVTIGQHEVTVAVSFALADAEVLRQSSAPLPPAGAVDWQVDDVSVKPSVEETRHQEGDNIEFRLVYPRGSETSARLHSTLLGKLPLGHRQLLTVRDAAGAIVDSRLLSAGTSVAVIDLGSLAGTPAAPASATPTFLGFLLLGIEHIAIGYDHLLFLFALLLVCESFSSAAKIITCFTIAHSISLALATMNVVALPSRLVETLIAASIVYVGIENLLARRPMRWRWVLTFSFGLIHGLGFASVLRELGIGAGGGAVLVPLLSFNLGVELGQIAIAALVLPLLLQLRRMPSFVRRGIPVTSGVLACAGAYWLIGRVMG